MADTHSLVADIGGTNTRVALTDGPRLLPETVRRYPNREFPGLESVLRKYLDASGQGACLGAAIAVAGPVHDGEATITNLDWATITGEMVARATGAERVAILNDLQAQGHALGAIAPDHLREVVAGPSGSPRSTQLVIGIGTGFNAASVLETTHGRLVTPSEAGHANMPIRTEDELRLLRFVENVHGFPAIEDVLSGRGLERIHAWLCQEAGRPAEASAADIMAALEAGEETAIEAGRHFVRILGTVAGNLALIHLPFGGIALIGGVARAFAPHMETLGFAEAFRDKGRFAGFMKNFRIEVVEDDYAALTGCAAHLAAEPV